MKTICLAIWRNHHTSDIAVVPFTDKPAAIKGVARRLRDQWIDYGYAGMDPEAMGDSQLIHAVNSKQDVTWSFENMSVEGEDDHVINMPVGKLSTKH